MNTSVISQGSEEKMGVLHREHSMLPMEIVQSGAAKPIAVAPDSKYHYLRSIPFFLIHLRRAGSFLCAISLVLAGAGGGVLCDPHVRGDGGLSPLFQSSLIQTKPFLAIHDGVCGADVRDKRESFGGPPTIAIIIGIRTRKKTSIPPSGRESGIRTSDGFIPRNTRNTMREWSRTSESIPSCAG